MTGRQRVVIPRTLEDATDHLDELGGLLTAKKWERAAIVATFVRLAPGRGQEPAHERLRNGASTISVEEFSRLGITGLSQPQAVRKYVQAWLDAHDGEYPKAGSRVFLPTVDFPPMRTGTDGYETLPGAVATFEKMVEAHGVDTVRDVIMATPKVAEEVHRGVVDRRVAEIDRLPGGRTIPEVVDQQSRGSAGNWEKTREAKMRDVLVHVRRLILEMDRLVEQGDLSSEELRLRDAFMTALMECVAKSMERLG